MPQLYKKEEIMSGATFLRSISILKYNLTIAGRNGPINHFPTSREKRILQSVMDEIKNDFDYGFIVRAGMGEAYLLNYTIDELTLRFKSRKPCIICPRASYREMFEMFHPNIPFYVTNVDRIEMSSSLEHNNIWYKGILFNINPFPLCKLKNLLNQYETGTEKRHYSEIIRMCSGVADFRYVQPLVSQITIQNALEKTSCLNKEKFVFLIPDANFVEKLPPDFWELLMKEIKKKGYDVLVNSPTLTLAESFFLASLSKGIISLRCGFSELLSILNVPKHIIYTRCKHVNIKDMVGIFSEKKYPHVNANCIHEYDAMKLNLNEILNNIVNNFL